MNTTNFIGYITQNAEMWEKVQKMEGNIDDIINFARFLLYDSIMVKQRNEIQKPYGQGLEEKLRKDKLMDLITSYQ